MQIARFPIMIQSLRKCKDFDWFNANLEESYQKYDCSEESFDFYLILNEPFVPSISNE